MKIVIVVVVMAVVAIIFIIAIIGVFSGIGMYNDLVKKDQHYKAGAAHYGAALDLSSQKIEAVWSIFNQYLKQEQVIFDKAKEMRAGFYRAAAEGDPKKTVEAATQFQIFAVKEAYPALSSVPVAQQSIRALEEGINEIKTSLDDWIFAAENYNSTRQSFFPKIIGNLAGFPPEYDYYKADRAKLDISNIKDLSLK